MKNVVNKQTISFLRGNPAPKDLVNVIIYTPNKVSST